MWQGCCVARHNTLNCWRAARTSDGALVKIRTRVPEHAKLRCKTLTWSSGSSLCETGFVQARCSKCLRGLVDRKRRLLHLLQVILQRASRLAACRMGGRPAAVGMATWRSERAVVPRLLRSRQPRQPGSRPAGEGCRPRLPAELASEPDAPPGGKRARPVRRSRVSSGTPPMALLTLSIRGSL